MSFQNTNAGKKCKAVLTVAAATVLALSTASLAAAIAQDRATRGHEQGREHQLDRSYHFQSADAILGKPLTNRSGEELGTIDDLIIDRGTGRIEALVIREGGFLGFGGTHVSIPFEAFFVDRENASLTLNASDDMLEAEDDVLPQGWRRLNDGWERELFMLAESEQVLRQELPAADRGAEIQTISGTITEIERIDLNEDRHWLHIEIGESADMRRNGERVWSEGKWVVLGPAWYCTGGDTPPVRGQRIEVEAFLGNDGQMFAKAATFDGVRVGYRTDDLEPLWTDRGMRSDSQRSPGPMVLLTNLIDERVIWGQTDEVVGEVSDAYLELTTGHVAVLAVDVNGDWWGRGEGPRGIPFDIARIGRDAVKLDATDAMLDGAEVLPEDPSVLRQRQYRERMFLVFEVQPPEFVARR